LCALTAERIFDGESAGGSPAALTGELKGQARRLRSHHRAI